MIEAGSRRRPLGRRAIVEDGVATYFLWDGLRLMETRNADGTLKARLTHGLARIEGIGSGVEIYVPSSSKRYYMLYDHRGSAHALLDESKSVVATRIYNAFGRIISETGTWPDEVPFGYQTNWLAPAGLTLPDGTRLYLSPTRVYHPGVGRFLQRDFLLLPGRNDLPFGGPHQPGTSVAAPQRYDLKIDRFTARDPSLGDLAPQIGMARSQIEGILHSANVYEYGRANPTSGEDPMGLYTIDEDCCHRIKAHVKRWSENLVLVENMYANWIPGQKWSTYGLRSYANAAGGRSEAYRQSPKCVREASDEVESLSMGLWRMYQLTTVGGHGFWGGWVPWIFGEEDYAQSQFMLTWIYIERIRTTKLMTKLMNIEQECIKAGKCTEEHKGDFPPLSQPGTALA